MLLQIFDNVGKYGPGLIFIISIYLLYKKPILLITYIIGYIFNILFNFGFKGIFRMPRPNENVEKFDAEIRIYSRWGELIWQSENGETWDGKLSNGEICSDNLLMYYINGQINIWKLLKMLENKQGNGQLDRNILNLIIQ